MATYGTRLTPPSIGVTTTASHHAPRPSVWHEQPRKHLMKLSSFSAVLLLTHAFSCPAAIIYTERLSAISGESSHTASSGSRSTTSLTGTVDWVVLGWGNPGTQFYVTQESALSSTGFSVSQVVSGSLDVPGTQPFAWMSGSSTFDIRFAIDEPTSLTLSGSAFGVPDNFYLSRYSNGVFLDNLFNYLNGDRITRTYLLEPRFTYRMRLSDSFGLSNRSSYRGEVSLTATAVRAPIPEPTSVSLLLIAVPLLLPRSLRKRPSF